jgi:hypothetical protein
MSEAPGGVDEPKDGWRWAVVGRALRRWESCNVEQSWFSLWPGLTRGGRLRQLEEEVLGPVALACGATVREWHCTTWPLGERRRGERGGSV